MICAVPGARVRDKIAFSEHARRAVKFIRDDGKPDPGEVHANLVQAARVRFGTDERKAVEAFDDFLQRARRTRVDCLRRRRHPDRSTARPLSDRQVDLAPVVGDDAMHQCQIVLEHAPLLEVDS